MERKVILGLGFILILAVVLTVTIARASPSYTFASLWAWTTSSESASCGGEQSTEHVHTLNNSYKFYNIGSVSQNAVCALYQDWPHVEGQSGTISGWFWISGTNEYKGYIRCQWLNSSHAPLATVDNVIVANHTWVQGSVACGTAPSGTAYARYSVGIKCYTASCGSLSLSYYGYADDVTVTFNDLLNGGMEYTSEPLPYTEPTTPDPSNTGLDQAALLAILVVGAVAILGVCAYMHIPIGYGFLLIAVSFLLLVAAGTLEKWYLLAVVFCGGIGGILLLSIKKH